MHDVIIVDTLHSRVIALTLGELDFDRPANAIPDTWWFKGATIKEIVGQPGKWVQFHEFDGPTMELKTKEVVII